MSNFIDLTGKRFGKLVVIRRTADHCQPSGQKKRKWLCKCDCGKEIEVREDSLKTGNTKSCGCSRKDYTDTRIEDLSGQRFGRLVATSFLKKKSKSGTVIYWKCQCDCGNETTVSHGKLKTGHTKSCGCYRSDLGHSKKVIKNQRIYNIWINMRQRCKNMNDINYKNYGGRGITIYKEWDEDFQKFYDWSIANGYSDELTIDRMNNNGNYEPSNCRWATQEIQQNNRRNNIRINIYGENLTIKEISEKYNISKKILVARYNHGILEEKRLLYHGNLRELK